MKLTFITTALLIGASGAFAQGLSGATVALEYTTYPDVDNETSTGFSGSAEFDIVNGFSVAADLSNTSFESIDENGTNVVVHAIYAINPDVSVGGFIGREAIDGEEIDNYGAEIAYKSGMTGLEAYLGAGDVNSVDLTYVGISGSYGLGNGISVIGGYDRVGYDLGGDVTVSAIDIGGEFAFSGGAAFYVKAGQLSLDTPGPNDEENYFEIGASFSFGPMGGTTFSSRGLLENVPAGAL